jgi:UDP-N-acetylglucosamine 4,6-dehydratase
MYFTDGQKEISTLEDYPPHNTDRLSIPELKQVLLKLDFSQRHLQGRDGGTTDI